MFKLFQSTPLSLAETAPQENNIINLMISIHSAIASGDVCIIVKVPFHSISIHSAIASGDSKVPGYGHKQMISIHSAIASGDVSRHLK